MYQISSEEEEQSLQKYLRLPTKKENDLQRNKLAEEVFMFRKKFHQVNTYFYCLLRKNFYIFSFNFVDFFELLFFFKCITT